ncbi:hypothetical protein HN51_063483 [Arachis hypogaea]
MWECSFTISDSFCCSYSPKATESLRLMLKYCTSYTSFYWRNLGSPQPYDRVPQYGIRIDFDIPVTTGCLPMMHLKEVELVDLIQRQEILCAFVRMKISLLIAKLKMRVIYIVSPGTITGISVVGAFRIGEDI